MAELFNREIGGQRCLSTLLSNDTDTDVCCLDHGHVIATVADTTNPLFGVFADEAGDVSFLGRRATACNNRWQLDSKRDEEVPVIVKEQSKRFSIDEEATIRLIAKEFELIIGQVLSFHCTED